MTVVSVEKLRGSLIGMAHMSGKAEPVLQDLGMTRPGKI